MTDFNTRGDEVTVNDTGEIATKYLQDAKYLLEDGLNSVSKSFCLAKWYNVSVHIPTGRTHSCYHPPTHKIPKDELAQNASALHNTEYKKKQRKLMLEGVRPEECSFCWDIEDSGNLSDRAYRSVDVYYPGAIQDAVRLGYEGNANPKYLEVNFSQACNLKCIYCSPHLSTQWHQEIKKHGSYKLHTKNHNDIGWLEQDDWKPDNHPNNPYLKKFWEWLPTIYDGLKVFRMTGGEPLMDKNTFKVFDYVYNSTSNDNIQISITSNCSPPENQWGLFMDGLKRMTDANKIDHFMLFCSVDGYGEQAEYMRSGLIFEQMLTNVNDYLANSKKHSLTFIITANLLSLPTLLTLIKEIHSLRKKHNTDRQLVWFDIPMLHDPYWLSLRNATLEDLENLRDCIDYMQEHIETVDNRFMGFKDYEIDKMKRLYSWAEQIYTGDHKKNAMCDLYLFVNELDRRRDTNFVDVFPEFKNLYIEAERIHTKTTQDIIFRG